MKTTTTQNADIVASRTYLVPYPIQWTDSVDNMKKLVRSTKFTKIILYASRYLGTSGK